MRKGSKKPILIYTGALAGALTLAVGSAFATELSQLSGYVNQLQKSQGLSCNDGDYWMPPNPPQWGAKQKPIGSYVQQMCQSQCNQAITNQAGAVKSKYESAVASDGAANGSSSAAALNGAAGSNGHSNVSQNTQNGNGAAAQAGLQQKAANAAGVAAAAKQCAEQIKNACPQSNIANNDMQKVKQAMDACQQLSNASDQVAEDKAKSSGGMGDLSQLAGALGQALGQMMQGGQGADPGYTPDTSSVTTPDPVAGTNIDPVGTNVAGTSIGNNPNGVDGVQFSKPNAANISGFTPNGTSFGPATSGSSYDTAGTGYGNDGYGGGSAGIAGYTGSGSGGSAGLNSSGASVAGLDAGAANAGGAGDAASAGPNDEINLAGGGGGAKPSFLGLKSSADEEQPGEPGVLDDLGLGSDEEGSRDLASNEEAGIAAENSGTLFTVIHTKISEIKRRGSI
jgi:hypothetical protein